MTDKEKARAYDEALKRADSLTEKYGGREFAEYVFPELKESEDERIRKWLVNYFKAAGKSWIHRDISPEQILAYLEKQKEPENTSASTMAPSCWAEDHPKEQKPNFDTHWENGSMVCEQKEHKPNIELIQRSWYMEGYHDRDFGNEPKWIIKTGEGGPKHELNPRYGQPLTERQVTEEQLHNLNEAIKSFRMDGFDRIADSLHSLYNILTTQEQKPAEWSEDDEDNLHRVIRVLEDNDSDWKELSDWLKSLRPQYHGDVTMTEAYKMGLEAGKASSWKPSEEQMEALKRASTNEYLPAKQFDILVSLYEQLKKLM